MILPAKLKNFGLLESTASNSKKKKKTETQIHGSPNASWTGKGVSKKKIPRDKS